MGKQIIGVIGGRRVKRELLITAEAVGRMIAERGLILICGGLTGVMEAVSKGAKEAGGITIGILPQDTKDEANPYIDIPIATGFGIGRNVIIVRTADVVIAIGGEYGTLSEIAFALQLGKPVIGIDTWDIKGLIRAVDANDAINKMIECLT
ncbi:MAG: TIGR00725 family protein [Thermodesulfovibrionia bacterium]